MRSKTSSWYEVKIKYDKMHENGMLKTVTELYSVDALSFTECEKQIIEETAPLISGEFKITNIAPATYREVFFSDVEHDDKWYKAKLQFITLDEKTDKERRQNVFYLVQANCLHTAVKYVEELMSKTMIDYCIVSVAETTIMDVYEHNAANNSAESDTAE